MGARDTNAVSSMEDRAKVTAVGIVKGVEKKAKVSVLKDLPPQRPSQKKEEARTFLLSVAAFRPLVNALVDPTPLSKEDMERIPTTELLVSCKARLVFWNLDAYRFLKETGVAQSKVRNPTSTRRKERDRKNL